jgi:ribosomal protein S27AE
MNSFSVNIVDAMYVLDAVCILPTLKRWGLWRGASVDGGGKGYRGMHKMLLVRVGKARNCNECGGEGTVFLYATPKGLWSHCSRCKFTEWEWRLGDNKEYLSYLADNFKCGVDDIVRALEVALNLSSILDAFGIGEVEFLDYYGGDRSG